MFCRWRHIITAIVTVSSVMTQSSRAQTRPDAAEEINSASSFHLDSPEVSLSLSGLYNTSSIRPAGGGAVSKGRDSLLEELLKIKTGGGIPKVANFTLSLSAGFDEAWQKQDDRRNFDVDAHLEYDLGLTLFPASAAPLEIRANRTIEYSSQPFSTTYRTTSNNYEADWRLKSDWIANEFRLFHNDYRQESFGGQDNFRSEQNGVSWDGHLIPGHDQTLDWNYTFRNVNQTDPLGKTTSYDAHEFNINHEYDFGAKREHSFTSSVDYLNQDGDFAQEHLTLNEELRFKHSEQFETFYQYQFDHTRYPEADSTLNRLKAGFREKISADLVLTGSLGGLTLDQSGAGTNELFADLNLDYSKELLGGLLTGGLRLNIDRQSNQAQNNEVHVIQTRTFGVSQEIVIPRVAVDLTTLRLRSASGLTFFSSGFDYLASYHNNRLVIDRIPGGNLAPDSSVLVDFDLAPQPANDVLTSGIDFNLRYDFKEKLLKGLSLYTRYVYQQQDISSEVPGAFVADDINALLFGAEYRIWRIRFSAEHEDHQSNLSPYHSDRLAIRYEDRIARDWRVLIEAARVQTLYEDDHSDPVATTVSGSVKYQASRSLSATASIAYLNLEDRLVSHAHGLEERIEMQWHHRDTTIGAQIRHSDLDTDTQNSSNFFFMLTFERKF